MSADPIPADAGLDAGRSGDSDPERRTGDDLIAAAGDGLALTRGEQQDLLDYFLTNEGLPGDDDVDDVEFTVGHGRKARTDVWQVKTITWDQWKDAVDRTTDEKTGERDTYATAAWIVARALVKPHLGPIVARLRDEASAAPDKKIGPDDARIAPPAHAPEFLQRMFAKQSGVLFALSAEVLRLSKLQDDNGSVRTLEREVEAGKP
jgi:hypothetical protein